MRRAAILLPVAALLLSSCAPTKLTLPQSPALKWLERKAGRIAFIDLDGNLRTTDQSGAAPVEITRDAAISDDPAGKSFYYQYPAWSPDGRSIAFVAVRKAGTTPQGFGVWTARADGSSPAELFSSGQQMPRLLSWAPDSARLVFLANGGEGEKLESVPAAGGKAVVLASGYAHAWRWGRATGSLILHTLGAPSDGPAERVSIVDPRGITGEQDLDLSPAMFEAPGWMADNKGIIVAVRENDSAVLYLADRAGQLGTRLTPIDGGVTFDVSPDGKTLAYATSIGQGQAAASRLSVLDLASRRGGGTAGGAPGASRVLSGEDFVAAFFWSPDSSHIAYFVPSVQKSDQGPLLMFTLKVLRVSTGAVRTVATFHPPGVFLQVVREYGQYGESLRMWSPDSRFVLYTAVEGDSPVVMVGYADEPIAPRKVADGLMATWSPN
jgi:hypothetical protein